MLSGAVAQYGRGVGMIQATASQIINQFAGNLRAQLTQEPPAAPPSPAPTPTHPSQPPTNHDAVPAMPAAPQRPQPPRGPQVMPPAAKPISGLSLMARVIWQRIVTLFTGRTPQ
jgi:hypothetical protein